MEVKRVVALVALVVLAVLTGCELQNVANDPNYIPSAVELTRIAQEMDDGPLKSTVQSEAVRRYVAAQEAQDRADAAQAIANAAANEAASHIYAMTAEAGATQDALSARATNQALDANLTRQAQAYHSEETRQAGDVLATIQASAATSTAQAVEGTRQAQESTRQAADAIASRTVQAVAAQETRVVVAYQDEATKVSVLATMTAVAWDGKMERTVKPILAGAGILTLVTFIGGMFYLGWKFYQVLEERARLVRPRSDEGEPIMLLESGHYALPYRSTNPVTIVKDGDVDSPLTAPSVAAQMAVTLSQQRANWERARQVGQVARAKNRVPQFVRVSNRTRFAQPGPIPQGENGQPWADVTPAWPAQVPLVGLFNERQPSLHHIIIGVAPRPGNGGLDIISSDLHELSHVLVVGSTGWGKSAWLRSFLWQIAKSREAAEVIVIDVSGSEMNALARWERLRYPVARTPAEAITLLEATSEEVERRMKLYERCPMATKLSEYNRENDELLTPWLVVADECAALLADRSTGDPLRAVLQQSRQYGVYVVASSVSATATVIPTPLRDMFSTRLAFRTNSGRVVVEDNRPKDLTVKGRAWAQLSGQPIREIQGPWLNRGEFVRTMTGDGPMLALPEGKANSQDSREQRVIELLESDVELSDSAIAQIVYGYQNGRSTELVRVIRDRQTDRQTASEAV